MSKLSRSKFGKSLSRLGRLVSRFARQERGATAIEFGMVAMPFLALTFAILETAIIFFAGQTLESAVQNASRLILTGQAQTGGANYSTADAFRTNAVCPNSAAFLFDCSKIYVDVKSYTSFGQISQTPPVTNNQFDQSKTGYTLAGPNCIQTVTVYYVWPVYVSLLSDNLSNLGNNRLLSASAVFKNEPYATSGGC